MTSGADQPPVALQAFVATVARDDLRLHGVHVRRSGREPVMPLWSREALRSRSVTVAVVAVTGKDSAAAFESSFARLCAGTVTEVIRRIGDDAGVVLDVGTGTGTVAAAAGGSGRRVTGMDIDKSMIALASRRHPNVAFARAALPQLPCADEAFDAITANFVINHTPDPRAAARDLRRVLRRDGQLVATIWPSQTLPLNKLWADVMRQASVSPPPGTRLAPELDFERTTDGFVTLLAGAGFASVDCQEMRWRFEIEPDQLWEAIEAGITVPGQTYQVQDRNGRERMRTAYKTVTGQLTSNGILALPSVALLASAWRTR